jgi:hypothetical protein
MSKVTAFLDDKVIATGDRYEVTRHIEERYAAADLAAIRVFENEGGRVVDLDYWDAAASSQGEEASRTRGRPKLGVTPREVTLLPRHWDWLASQPGGASAALRRLVETASKEKPGSEAARDATYRFMSQMCGDRPNYEEALRALYRGDGERLESLTAAWPDDIRAFIRELLAAG